MKDVLAIIGVLALIFGAYWVANEIHEGVQREWRNAAVRLQKMNDDEPVIVILSARTVDRITLDGRPYVEVTYVLKSNVLELEDRWVQGDVHVKIVKSDVLPRRWQKARFYHKSLDGPVSLTVMSHQNFKLTK